MLAAAVGLLLLGPRLQERWIYLQTNFFVPKEVDRAIGIVERGAKVGYNGVVFTDTKLQAQAPYPDFYQKNVRRFLDAAKKNHVQVIPCAFPVGYANGMLARNPSLIESMPCRGVPYMVHQGFLQPEGMSTYANGGFESANGDAFTGFAFQDGIGKTTFADAQIHHGGAKSLRMQDPGTLTETHGNCRVMQKVTVEPWRQYRLTFWVKTENFDRASSFRVLFADSKVKPLGFQDVSIQPTQDWTRCQAVFNPQANREMLIYIGVWEGNKGKLWLDDVTLEAADLLNVTRRDGCPLTLKGENGMTYTEGRDVEPTSDPKFGNQPWPGEYDLGHEVPKVKLTPNTRLREGQRVRLSFYVATIVGAGQAVICPSEKATDTLMREEAARIEDLFHPEGVFVCHDEMRVYNWCEACQKRNLTPGAMLAADFLRCRTILRSSSPKAKHYVWSDMFDPFHNAVDDYYLVNGSWKGSWDGVPKDVVIVNWNSGRPKESLGFFAGRGNHQILAGYYDGPVNAIQDWLKAGEGLAGIEGVMYTTWANRYDDLEAFAKAAWGGKPL